MNTRTGSKGSAEKHVRDIHRKTQPLHRRTLHYIRDTLATSDQRCPRRTHFLSLLPKRERKHLSMSGKRWSDFGNGGGNRSATS